MLEFKFAEAPDEVYTTAVSSLKAGGAGNEYKFINSTDLRKLKLPGGVQYALQAVHNSTLGNETLNWVVTSNNSKITVLQAFSISQAEGTYCDGGQNYKNLVGFIKGLAELFAQKAVYGCQAGKSGIL